MAKTKSVYFCNNCGAESPKWIGRCPVCGEWNTYVEEVVSTKSAAGGRGEFGTMEQSKVRPQRIDDIQITEESRIDLGNGELNRVLGGGLVRGSLVLICIGGGKRKAIEIESRANRRERTRLLYRVRDIARRYIRAYS